MTASVTDREPDAEGFDFLLNLLECDPPDVSGAVLVDAHPEVGQQLGHLEKPPLCRRFLIH